MQYELELDQLNLLVASGLGDAGAHLLPEASCSAFPKWGFDWGTEAASFSS